jgi:hypothetical protein
MGNADQVAVSEHVQGSRHGDDHSPPVNKSGSDNARIPRGVLMKPEERLYVDQPHTDLTQLPENFPERLETTPEAILRQMFPPARCSGHTTGPPAEKHVPRSFAPIRSHPQGDQLNTARVGDITAP